MQRAPTGPLILVRARRRWRSSEYNILRGCIHDLADQHGLSLQGRPFHVLNRVLDEAIGLAVHAFATQKAFEVQPAAGRVPWREVSHDRKRNTRAGARVFQ
ncbi:MAG TPA: hypothetical protein VFZ57_03200, partial [Thermoanaerobaculia bacterium]|nr:hypothetical protein [Thermoanaerobaculia bacterium]